MPKITGILIDVETGKAGAKTIDRNLESYYKHLNCETIDIVEKKIGSKIYNIICDDEALLKSPAPDPSALSNLFPYKYSLFGNLFVTGPADDEGNLTSIPRSEIKSIMRNHIRRDYFHGYGSRGAGPILIALDPTDPRSGATCLDGIF